MINLSRLKDIREDHDISQSKMADILGTSRSTYSLWELGINIIPLKNLCKYADYFNYSIDYVLGLSKNRKEVIIKGLDPIILGKNLRELRISNNYSQEQLANIIGVTQVCITRYEKGVVYISTSNLYKLSKLFKVSMSKLCGKTK